VTRDRRYRYFICDVFTETRFGGNQLAVLPHAEGLAASEMQQIAREFNFAETTFVLPPEKGHTRRVRIFTPATEMPFAGHPNIGTAFALAASGELGTIASPTPITFEEIAGPVPIEIRPRGEGRFWCELSAPEPLSVGPTVSPEAVAAGASLRPEDVATETHPPLVASVGLPFVFAELRDRDALARARASVADLEAIASVGAGGKIHLYVRTNDEFDIRVRMFAPLDGVPEDAATGSANCALVGLLARYHGLHDGEYRLRIAQGVEMGRPSVLDARARRQAGAVTEARIGGSTVLVSEGAIDVG
jgi:trans-2,3-dihydro-3-hydroxyanthranilate isomerase